MTGVGLVRSPRAFEISEQCAIEANARGQRVVVGPTTRARGGMFFNSEAPRPQLINVNSQISARAVRRAN
jgi:hypothetical protein